MVHFSIILLTRKVDGEIIAVLRNRYKECVIYEMPDQARKCEKMRVDFEDASTNFCIKCKLSVE